MKQDNKIIGRIGEGYARELLSEMGYRLVEKNYSNRWGEIDLICEDNDVLVFVEVKTKKGLEFGTPEEMFTQGKRSKVKRMAMMYLEGKEVKCRIDMVAVVLDKNNELVSIKHYQDVQ
jgi:putative endonuclease